MRKTLSVAIITRNEEANLGRTLGSVAWADEIVVVDSGSDDRTEEIARKCPDAGDVWLWVVIDADTATWTARSSDREGFRGGHREARQRASTDHHRSASHLPKCG